MNLQRPFGTWKMRVRNEKIVFYMYIENLKEDKSNMKNKLRK